MTVGAWEVFYFEPRIQYLIRQMQPFNFQSQLDDKRDSEMMVTAAGTYLSLSDLPCSPFDLTT